jgi:hypothetical protein
VRPKCAGRKCSEEEPTLPVQVGQQKMEVQGEPGHGHAQACSSQDLGFQCRLATVNHGKTLTFSGPWFSSQGQIGVVLLISRTSFTHTHTHTHTHPTPGESSHMGGSADKSRNTEAVVGQAAQSWVCGLLFVPG